MGVSVVFNGQTRRESSRARPGEVKCPPPSRAWASIMPNVTIRPFPAFPPCIARSSAHGPHPQKPKKKERWGGAEAEGGASKG
eukprot:scaffold181903_cov30-Tisochrysis_lutea.AAC.1